jgi:hypothetical protein
MQSTYGHWNSIGVYEPLESIIDELLLVAGLELKDTETGLYINVPMRPETIPTQAEYVAFLATQAPGQNKAND